MPSEVVNSPNSSEKVTHAASLRWRPGKERGTKMGGDGSHRGSSHIQQNTQLSEVQSVSTGAKKLHRLLLYSQLFFSLSSQCKYTTTWTLKTINTPPHTTFSVLKALCFAVQAPCRAERWQLMPTQNTSRPKRHKARQWCPAAVTEASGTPRLWPTSDSALRHHWASLASTSSPENMPEYSAGLIWKWFQDISELSKIAFTPRSAEEAP